jgi:hypothetical protein
MHGEPRESASYCSGFRNFRIRMTSRKTREPATDKVQRNVEEGSGSRESPVLSSRMRNDRSHKINAVDRSRHAKNGSQLALEFRDAQNLRASAHKDGRAAFPFGRQSKRQLHTGAGLNCDA